MNDDDPWDETPRCMSCGEQLGYLREVVQIDMGKMTVGKKSGLHYFTLTEDFPFPDGSPFKLIHVNCLLTLMDFANAHDNDMLTCNICERDLTGGSEVYRLRIGMMMDTGDDPFWEFVPKDNDDVTVYLCTACILDGLGEGDIDTGCVMMGMA